MGIFKSLGNGVSRSAARIIFKGKKHSPEILVGSGIVLGIGACVSACKSTLKAEEVLREIDRDLNAIKEAAEVADPEKYTDKDKAKDLTVAYFRSGIKFAKLYWKPLILGSASIACILSGHNITRKRNLALIALNAGLERKYNDLYSRVKDEFSEEAAKRFAHGVKNTEVEEVNEKGKVKKRRIDLLDPNKELAPYEYIIGPENPMWTKNMDYNLMWLTRIAKWAEDQVVIHGHLTLSELLPELGIERTRDDYITGWVAPANYYKTTCEPYVKFDWMRVWREDEGGNPQEVILLNLNCDGYIWDKI